MPTFRYQAIDLQRRPLQGEVTADSVVVAIDNLQAQGWVVQSIAEIIEPTPITVEIVAAAPAPTVPGLVLSEAECVELQSHLGVLMSRSVAMLPAFEAYVAELPISERGEWQSALKIVQRGDATAALHALRERPEPWMVLLGTSGQGRNGEHANSGQALQNFLRESRWVREVHRQRWLALLYPLVIASLAIAVLTYMSFLIMPIYEDIFVGFNLSMPWLTRVVFAGALAITNGTALLIAILIIAFGAVLYFTRSLWSKAFTPNFRRRCDLPFGRRSAVARFSQYTADLLEAGLELPIALKLSALATRRIALRCAAWQMAERCRGRHDDGEETRGETSYPFRLLDYPRTSLLEYALVGPHRLTAKVKLLREFTAAEQQSLRYRWSWTRGLIEPIAVALVGLLVGVVVLALFLPLISMTAGLSM